MKSFPDLAQPAVDHLGEGRIDSGQQLVQVHPEVEGRFLAQLAPHHRLRTASNPGSSAAYLCRGVAVVGTAGEVPLRMDVDGAYRVGGTRVTLDTVVAAFEGGASPEEIATRFPVLRLPDLYLVLGYYLAHERELSDYLEVRRSTAADARTRIEDPSRSSDLRNRLLARRTSR